MADDSGTRSEVGRLGLCFIWSLDSLLCSFARTQFLLLADIRLGIFTGNSGWLVGAEEGIVQHVLNGLCNFEQVYFELRRSNAMLATCFNFNSYSYEWGKDFKCHLL